MNKTIVISNIHPLINRNVLSTGILEGILNQGVKVVIIVPKNKVEYFTNTYQNTKNVFIEGIGVSHEQRISKIIHFISYSIVGVQNHIVWEWKTHGKLLKYYTAQLIHKLFKSFFLPHRVIRVISYYYFRSREAELIFKKHNPDLVFSTDIFNFTETQILVEANRQKIKTLGMVRSWDNATTKGVLLFVPDSMIVTNEVLQEELVKIHRIPPQKMVVTGIPHYDEVVKEVTMDKESFYEKMGLDINKKTILFAPGGKMLYKHDDKILEVLKSLIDKNRFDFPVQVLVRFPPADRLNIDVIKNDPNFIIDNPGQNVTGRKKDSEITKEDNSHLNCSIVHSDIVLTLTSTMVIDACVFDKPTIIWSYEPSSNLLDPINKFLRYDHFKKVYESGFVRFAMGEDEFIKLANNYFANPALGREGRSKMSERYAYKLDGNSSKRVLEIVVNLLK